MSPSLFVTIHCIDAGWIHYFLKESHHPRLEEVISSSFMELPNASSAEGKCSVLNVSSLAASFMREWISVGNRTTLNFRNVPDVLQTSSVFRQAPVSVFGHNKFCLSRCGGSLFIVPLINLIILGAVNERNDVGILLYRPDSPEVAQQRPLLPHGFQQLWIAVKGNYRNVQFLGKGF